MKKKKTVQPEAAKPTDRNPTAFPLSDMAPSDELQVYYNEAYLREKKRFNDIFGIIEQEEQEKEKVYIPPSPDEYVTMKKYKRLQNVATAFIALTILFAAAAVVLGLKFFNII